MEVCLAYMREKPVILRLQEGVVYINDEPQAIKGITEEDLHTFSKSIADIPYSTDQEGYKALINAKRAAFLATLLGNAVGDDSVNTITHILDSVHYEVLMYLGEVAED